MRPVFALFLGCEGEGGRRGRGKAKVGQKGVSGRIGASACAVRREGEGAARHGGAAGRGVGRGAEGAAGGSRSARGGGTGDGAACGELRQATCAGRGDGPSAGVEVRIVLGKEGEARREHDWAGGNCSGVDGVRGGMSWRRGKHPGYTWQAKRCVWVSVRLKLCLTNPRL